MKRHLLSAALAAILTGAAFAQTPAVRPLAFKDAAVGIEFTRDPPKLDEFFSINTSPEWGPQAGAQPAAIPGASMSTPGGSLIEDVVALPYALGDAWNSTASASPADEDPLGPAPMLADDEWGAPYTVSSNTVAEDDPLGAPLNFQDDDAM